jgi:hypothetical protein
VLVSPLVAAKTRKFVTDYRPKSLEERVRRAYGKQLEYQVNRLMVYKQVNKLLTNCLGSTH